MKERYESPLSTRYASEAMVRLFSPQYKHSCWRRLWIALAVCQKELGLNIAEDQIQEMRQHQDDIDFEKAWQYEKKFRHDVMAHIHTFGDQCPKAKPIIHLGATSCYVTDNSELIQIREGLSLIRHKLIQVLRQLAEFSSEQKERACLAFTHYQPAQLTTVGKRACLWLQDFLLDFHDTDLRLENLRFLGVKGTTGTQASFLKLFDGDHRRVKELDRIVAKEMGFEKVFTISGQTYTRKQDCHALQVLAGIGASAHKMATDLRLLSNLREIEEPFEQEQVGSSAMPYKRNPMRSERICALSRFLISLNENPLYTTATQWFERTLDDSANRRVTIAEAFLTADAVLNLLLSVTKGLVVYPKVIQQRLSQELPFMATENILMQAVQQGGDRQTLHEKLRQHSFEAARRIKEEGLPNDLLDRLLADKAFGLDSEILGELLDAKAFIGRSAEQVQEFLRDEVSPVLSKAKNLPPPSFSVEV